MDGTAKSTVCVFCDALNDDAASSLVLFRGSDCFVILNLYPYNNGHLMVVVGFEADGDVVVNDPAGATNAEVRRVYDRAQFERIWIAASGGTAYVIRNS